MTKSGKAPSGGDRSARLRAALRENLKRRKAQAKGRANVAAPPVAAAAAPQISAGIAGNKTKG